MAGKEAAAGQQCREENNSSKSTSFDDFRSMMETISERYSPLNPFSGELFKHLNDESCPDGLTPNETGIEFIRGGIVATVAAWEKFLPELFKEAFEILIKVGLGEPANIENLKRLWPGCNSAIEKGRKIKVKRNPQSGSNGGDNYKELLNIHMTNLLECKSILPLFLGRAPHAGERFMTIDSLFVQLFQISGECPSLSQLVVEIGSLCYRMPYEGKDDLQVKLKQTEGSYEPALKALNNISRLYYGLRCTLVHGKHKRTLEQSLRDFPESEEDFPLPTACKYPSNNNVLVANYYIRLYKWIEEYGREVWVNYLTLLYITRFYKAASYSVMLAVAKWLYDTTSTKDCRDGILIWGYKPKDY